MKKQALILTIMVMLSMLYGCRSTAEGIPEKPFQDCTLDEFKAEFNQLLDSDTEKIITFTKVESYDDSEAADLYSYDMTNEVSIQVGQMKTTGKVISVTLYAKKDNKYFMEYCYSLILWLCQGDSEQALRNKNEHLLIYPAVNSSDQFAIGSYFCEVSDDDGYIVFSVGSI